MKTIEKVYYLTIKEKRIQLSFLFFFLLCQFTGFGQKSIYFPPPPKDTAAKKKIEVLQTDSMLYRTAELGTYRKLIGNVILKHADAKMYCDSAIIDVDANYMTAYGKQVHIKKGDSVDVWGNFLEYFGDQKQARLTGMCTMRDKTMILSTPELNYNLDTDVGNYMSGGRIVNKETTITSAIGYYYHKQSEALFYGDVVLRSPDKTIYADSMRYNTQKEIVYFITKTKIIDKDGSVIETNSGFYDTKNEKAILGNNATIHKGDATVNAQNIDYNKSAKEAIAQGNVIWHDSSERTTILSNYIFSNETNEYVKAYKDPLMITVSEDLKDTMYMSADTLLTFKTAISKWEIKTDSLGNSDSTEVLDSIKILKAYNKMKMIQGEMSATADSLFYSAQDSIFKLYTNPILWMDSTQITGDSIYLYTKNNEINRVDIYNNAMVVNMQENTIFNQLKGKFIQAFIRNKKIEKIEVDGNAESIYFIKDKETYTGANKSVSAFITVSFKAGEINRIKLTGTPEAEFTPMKKITAESFKLEGFIWYWDKKPLTFNDIIRDKNQYENYIKGLPKKTNSNTQLKE